jgi:hypothetical protein
LSERGLETIMERFNKWLQYLMKGFLK